MICDTLENASLYKYGNSLRKAVEFVRSVKSDTPVGRHELGGKMYANVMTYTTKDAPADKLEIHRKYVDLQAVICGCEVLCVCEKSTLTVLHPYEEEKDYGFLAPSGEKPLSRLEMVPGMFALFFPQDAHIGQCAGKGGAMEIKKVVVKIPVEEL